MPCPVRSRMVVHERVQEALVQIIKSSNAHVLWNDGMPCQVGLGSGQQMNKCSNGDGGCNQNKYHRQCHLMVSPGNAMSMSPESGHNANQVAVA